MIKYAPEYAICHNARVQHFPLCGLKKVTVCSRTIFKEKGWELADGSDQIPSKQEMEEDHAVADERDRSDNERRARQYVLHMAMLNTFSHFITWTLNRKKIDRYDSSEVSKKLKVFLKNAVARYGLKYIILPEFHKDGAIHMHGLISGSMKMEDSHHHLLDGRMIYNMPQWKYGWTTAIETQGDMKQIARYITKYITKSGGRIFGNYYYAGGEGLIRRPEEELFDVDFEETAAEKEYYVSAVNASFKYIDDLGGV